jgi:DNA-binding XRE family transcriptional regulator
MDTWYNGGMTPEDLKTWRKQHAYTQQRLANTLGVIKLTVGRWERGDRQIPSFLHLALDALECRGGEKKPREMKTRKENV